MIVLSELLERGCIKLNMQAVRKREAIEELVEILVKAGKVAPSQAKTLVKEVLKQETIASTGIGDGIAIPHKLVSQVSTTMIAFGRKKSGLDFQALDYQDVSLLFLILGPKGKPVEHLQLLSKLSRFLHDPAVKTSLLEAETPDEILATLHRKEGN